MEPSDVFLKRPLALPLDRPHVEKAVLDAREDEWKGAATMRQHDFQFRKFVERTGDHELCSGRRVFKSKAQPVRQAWIAGESFAVNVCIAVEWMKQQRIAKFFAPRKERLE